MNAKGWIEAIGGGRKRKAGVYQTTVNDLLRNVAMIGKTYSVSRRRREGELIDAQWPAIIDEETWEAVQRVKAGRWHMGGRRPRHDERRTYSFQGLLVCECGRRLQAKTMKARAYYECRGIDCAVRRLIREDKVLPWADALVEAISRNHLAVSKMRFGGVTIRTAARQIRSPR